eukprot:gene7389-7455_t
MLIVCPACASSKSTHVIDADLVSDGVSQRQMMCESCGHAWIAAGKHSEITARAGSNLVRRPAQPNTTTNGTSKTPRTIWRSSAVWAAIVLVLGSIPLAVAKRDNLVRRIPQMAAVFEKIGLPVNVRGLTFSDVKTRVIDDNGQKILTVEGTIASISKSSTRIPPMLISLRGKDGRELYHWTAQAEQRQLEPGANMQFRTRLASPPENAQMAYVNFTNAEDKVLR